MNEPMVAGAKPLSQFLRMAVVAGVESAVQIHIDRGDDLNARDASGMTPLMLSAVRDKSAICTLLLLAGADPRLLNYAGKTAFDIALDAGSLATAAVLNAFLKQHTAVPDPEQEAALELEDCYETSSRPKLIAEAGETKVCRSDTAPNAEQPELPKPIAREPEQPWVSDTVGDVDSDRTGEFDLSGWEAEDEATQPVADPKAQDSASATQTAITAYEPIDSSAEWDDIDAYLPEFALPLARADDAEGRTRLRRLLLRALREGSVPALDVKAESTNEDRSSNLEAESYLAMVINDLGAEVDERFEYSVAHESFDVFVDPEETPEEEATVDEALAAIDRAASPRHQPLRIYQREFQRLRLLSAEEEIRLAKDMDAALDAALDALATWPDGIARTLAAGAAAVAGSRQLSSIWIGGEPDPEPASEETFETEATVMAEPEDTADEDGETSDEAPADVGDAVFAEALRRLSALVEREDGSRPPSHQEIRQALANLRINRRFLLELTDAACGSAPCPGFRLAMSNFLQARNKMAAANLKLAFFHAKKYLYSGEPLDDLAQEGNIGLLKAVDRYDWRRGFRFSTYATWWIRQQIARHVADKVRTIRLPVHLYEKLQRAERMARNYEAAFGREPTLDELAERADIPRPKLAALLRIAPEPSAIDESTIDGLIAIDARDAYSSPDPEDAVHNLQLIRAVEQYVSSLSTKDRKEESILRLRFGMGVQERLTLEEVGMRFEVTRERIRQIEAKALKKLRHPARLKPFARMALGLGTNENPLAPNEQEHETDDGSDIAVEAAPLPDLGKGASPTSPKRESIHPAGSGKPSALDKVLAQAAELGVPFDDGRETASGRIWVSLVATPDNSHRRLARKLIEFGFEHWPGKGYWR